MQHITQDAKSVLVISDLSENVQQSDIELFFEDYKEYIALIEFRPKFDFLNRPNNATIIFKDFNKANKARLGLNMKKLKGRTVRITWHEKDSTLRYTTNCNLYVKNIPSQVSSRQFFEHFLQFGDIISAKLAENEEGDHLGYGYIHYATSDAVDKCINTCDNQEWYGQVIKVEQFQKKNERPSILNPNCSLFIKNFPSKFNEDDIKNLFPELSIDWMKVNSDDQGRKTAYITFTNEEDAFKAKQKNGTFIEGNEIFVDILQSKTERKKILSNKITEKNSQLANIYKDCNLYVKNLPLDMTEDELRTTFSKFGEINSVKIKTQVNSTKIKDKFVDTLVSCGYGYVCFKEPESAKEAFAQLNGKVLEEFKAKKPLEISYFTSFHERKSNTQKNYILNKRDMYDNNYKYNTGNKQNRYQAQQQMQQPQQINTKPEVIQLPIQTKEIAEPDYNLLLTIEDENEKREYLGEFIFNKINVHELTEKFKLTVEDVGKITGMIISIENIFEVIDICKNKDNLSSRIFEALQLLQRSG